MACLALALALAYVLPCLALPCLGVCLALPCLALPCRDMSYRRSIPQTALYRHVCNGEPRFPLPPLLRWPPSIEPQSHNRYPRFAFLSLPSNQRNDTKPKIDIDVLSQATFRTIAEKQDMRSCRMRIESRNALFVSTLTQVLSQTQPLGCTYY